MCVAIPRHGADVRPRHAVVVRLLYGDVEEGGRCGAAAHRKVKLDMHRACQVRLRGHEVRPRHRAPAERR